MLVVSYHNNYNVAKLHMFLIMAVFVKKQIFDIYPVLFLNILDTIYSTPVKSMVVLLILDIIIIYYSSVDNS